MYKKLLNLLKFSWGFSRTEANGFIVLSFLMLVCIITPFLVKHYLWENRSTVLSDEDAQALDSLIASLEKHVQFDEDSKDVFRLNPEIFDPNKVSSEELSAFGLPDFLANRIVNYREKVSMFQTKQELLKIYGLDSGTYLQLAPYIKIEAIPEDQSVYQVEKEEYRAEKFNNAKYEKKSSESFKLAPIELNSADTSQLKKIYGIGPAFAKRIVAFREALGGFHSTDQLKEVYGLEGASLDSVLNYTFLNEPIVIERIDLNTSSKEVLSKHPYINNKQAQLIVSYRNQHGNFNSVDELIEIKALNSSFLNRVKPYLMVQK